MYTNEYNTALERLHTISELTKDLYNYEHGMQLLQHYSREESWNWLQRIICEYREQIELCGLVEGLRLYSNVQISQYSDQQIYSQLMYVTRRIPMYVMVRESQKELAKQIIKWLDGKEQS